MNVDYKSLALNTIVCAEATAYLGELPENSVDLIVTSPPYDKLRKYTDGYSFNFEGIAKECYRVLRDGGVMVWVVGDATVKGSETLTSMRQALYFVDVCGFKMHDTMIYAKNGAIMNNHHPRYIDAFEYMFVLKKGEKNPTFNPVMRDNVNESNLSGGQKRQRNGQLKYYGNERIVGQKQSLEWNIWRITSGNNQTTKDKIAFQHPAMFPEELARRHIHTWSNEGDIVLDPFMGSGTVAKMAMLMKRNFIGCDISQDYVDIANERLAMYVSQAESVTNDTVE